MHPHFLKCAHDRPFRMIRVHKLYDIISYDTHSTSVLIFIYFWIVTHSSPSHSFTVYSQINLNQLDYYYYHFHHHHRRRHLCHHYYHSNERNS